ncbi:MAG: HNH endonuclease signature motif containing protein [Pseudomonadota bacterium]
MRVTRCTASQITRCYGSDASSGSVVGNDPINGVDPTGKVWRAIVSGGKVLGKAIFKGKRVDKAAVDEFVGAVDDVATIISDPLSVDAAAAAVDLVVGTELNNKGSRAASETAGRVGNVSKPPTGPGAVPKDMRDPKRTFSPSERAAKRDEQGNQCATGCGTEIDASNSQGHHIVRHADGGQTTSDNHVEVCLDCHKEIHRPD